MTRARSLVGLGFASAIGACSIAGSDDVPATDDASLPAFDAGRDATSETSARDDAISGDDSTTDETGDAPALDATSDGGLSIAPGVNLHAGGATFRAWGPHATSIAVVGDFNGWDETKSPLTSSGDGWWSIDVDGAKAGDEYAFVVIDASATPNKAQKNDPWAREMTSSTGHAVLVDPGAHAWADSTFTPPAFDHEVIYELHVGTFVPPSTTGKPATFRDAMTKLDALAAVGVNAIEVMPIGEFSGDYSWGYNPAYPFAVEGAYGSPEDFAAFVDEAHARSIAVIVDVVHNHYGRADLSPLGMWCWDLDCLGAQNGGAWFYTDANRETGFGPRPDFDRPEVRASIVANAMQWLLDDHADGLRWDSVVNIRRAGTNDLADGWLLLQQINDAIDARKPSALSIAEDLQGYDAINQPTNSAGAGFDAQWDDGFFWTLKNNVVPAADSSRKMNDVKGALTTAYAGSGLHRVIYTEDHDQVAEHNGAQHDRLPFLIDGANPASYAARKRSTLAASILLTAPGIPMLFMGQEMLTPTQFDFAAKTPLDWSLATTNGPTLALYRDLVSLRRDLAGTTAGLTGKNVSVYHVNDTDKVIAYRRWKNGGPGDDVIVLANFSAKRFATYDVGLPAAGTWKVRFDGDDVAYGADFGGKKADSITTTATARDGFPNLGGVSLAPYSVVVLSQD